MYWKGKILTVIEWVKTYNQKENLRRKQENGLVHYTFTGMYTIQVVAYTETRYSNVSSEGVGKDGDRASGLGRTRGGGVEGGCRA